MHSLQKGMKKSLTSKITECIEEGIKSAFERHAGALNPNSNDAATIETKNEIGQRGKFLNCSISIMDICCILINYYAICALYLSPALVLLIESLIQLPYNTVLD